jgi:hypothetical protein
MYSNSLGSLAQFGWKRSSAGLNLYAWALFSIRKGQNRGGWHCHVTAFHIKNKLRLSPATATAQPMTGSAVAGTIVQSRRLPQQARVCRVLTPHSSAPYGYIEKKDWATGAPRLHAWGHI